MSAAVFLHAGAGVPVAAGQVARLSPPGVGSAFAPDADAGEMPAAAGPFSAPAGVVPGASGQDARRPAETISDVPRAGRLALFKAQEKKERGEFEAAAGILARFIAEHPKEDHYLIRYNYGNTLVRLERLEEALEQYRAATRLEDRAWQAWLNLGETAYNLALYAEAAGAITRGHELAPEKQPRMLFFAGAAWLMAGEAAAAKPLLERVASGPAEGQQLDWHRALVLACIDLEDDAGGRVVVERMLDLFPGDPKAWDIAFQFAASRRDYRRAAVALTVRSYLEPLDIHSKEQLGVLYASLEIPWLAGVWFEEAMTDSATTGDYERLASVYLAAHESERAMRTLEKALSKRPTARLWSLVGDLHYMERRYEQAYEAFSESWKLDRMNGRAALMLGFCALELGRTEEAIPHLKLAAEFPEYAGNANVLLRRARQANGG